MALVLRDTRIGLFCLAVLMLWSYRSVATASFVYEDAMSFTPFTSMSMSPRGLTAATFHLQSGSDAGAYHLGNVSVHLLNGLLLYALVSPLWGGFAALVAVMLWWLHPVQSEAVAYVAARADLLQVTAILGMLIFATSGRGWIGIVGAACCAVLAVWAKEMGIMAVPLLALWVMYLKRSQRRWLWVYGSGVVLVGLSAWMILPRLSTWVQPSARPPWWFLGVQAFAVLRLSLLGIWPVGFTLAHDWDAIGFGSAILALLMLVAVLFAVRPWPRIRFAAWWMAISLAPRFLVPLPQWTNEHQMHLAWLGPTLAVASYWAPSTTIPRSFI